MISLRSWLVLGSTYQSTGPGRPSIIHLHPLYSSGQTKRVCHRPFIGHNHRVRIVPLVSLDTDDYRTPYIHQYPIVTDIDVYSHIFFINYFNIFICISNMYFYQKNTFVKN